MQFRLVHLLAAMGAMPIACGMLVYATPWGAAAIFSLSNASLLAAFVLVAVANGPSRSSWIGFAVFGIGYWAILNSSVLSMHAPDETTRRLRQDGPPLITAKILEWLYDRALPLVHKQP